MNTSERTRLVDEIASKLVDHYVFPEMAGKMATSLRASLATFDGLSADDFATALTENLQATSRDKHVRVRFREEPFRDMQTESGLTAEQEENLRLEEAAENFGFARVEILEGNIGFIELRGFAPPAWAGPKASAAMMFVADTRALIVDLRDNGGGEAEMVALLCSYFFPAQPLVHLNSIYTRPGDSTVQYWTTAELPAPRYLDRPVYLLTSSQTFSAGEEFLYNLKHLKRATLVGETTRGGAHPVDFYRLHNPHFLVVIPTSRSINPITGTNWEGVGVEPHIYVSASKALDTAHQMALADLKKATLPVQRPQLPNLSILLPSRPSGYSQERATPLQVIV